MSRMHNKDSLRIARQKETDCFNSLKEKGYKIRLSNSYEDMNDHIDFFIEMIIDGLQINIGVDVKANKIYNNQYRFIELQNVNGTTGSLNGKADFLAFEEPDGYIYTNRQQLADFVNSNIDRSELITKFRHPDSMYLKQFRSHAGIQDRKDIITLVKLSDLRKFKYFKVFNNGEIEWKL